MRVRKLETFHEGPDPKLDKMEVMLFKLHGLTEKVRTD